MNTESNMRHCMMRPMEILLIPRSPIIHPMQPTHNFFLLVLLFAVHLVTSTTSLTRDRDDLTRLDNVPDDDYTDAMHLPLPLASHASALLVHYTARERMPEAEESWNQINAQQIDIRFYDDNASRALVAQYRPEFLEIYDTKLTPVERADYFRYLVLWVYGGLYIDSDIDFIQPVAQWLDTFGWDPDRNGWRLLETIDLTVGIEFPTAQTEYSATGWLPLQITQFVIAGAKYSDVLKHIMLHIEECVQTIDRNDDVEMTLQRTGPAAFTRAILNDIQSRGLVSPSLDQTHQIEHSDTRYPHALMPLKVLEKNGQLIPLKRPAMTPQDPTFRNRPFDYILILPYRAFGYHESHGLAEAPVLTRHNFHNSWRHSDDSV